MTTSELATMFVEVYNDDISKQLKIQNFKKSDAIKGTANALRHLKAKKKELTAKDVLTNKGLIKDIIGMLTPVLVPATAQKFRNAQATIAGIQLGQKLRRVTKAAIKIQAGGKKYFNR